MASEIRVNQIQNRSGLSTVTFSDTGVVVSGITTITDLRASGNTIVAAGSTSAPSISPTGDSNTGIFFPSADTIAFAEGGAEAARFDSNGNLGINTASVPDKLTVLGKIQVQQDASSNNRLVLRGQPGSSYRWNIDNYSSSNDFRIFREDDATAASGAIAVSISSTRNVTLSNGNLVFSTAGTGIDFSATANSSGTMTSELLTDYEEGTWTPSWCNSSGSAYGTITYNTRIGMYTKIGNIVYYDIHLITTSWGGTTGTAWVSGLPYAATNARYQLGGGGIFCVQGVDGASAISNLTTQIASSGTVVELYYQTASTGNNYNVFGTGDINETGTVSIRIGGFYFT